MRVALPFLLLSLTGCPAPAPSSDAGTDVPLAVDSPTSDAPTEGLDAPTEGLDAPDDAGGMPRGAQVAIIQARDGSSHTLAGVFYGMRTIEDLRMGNRDGCTVMAEVGACRSLTCGGLEETVNAGTLSAIGASTLTAEASGGRYFVTQPSAFFASGETIRFTTTGDVVPAFTASVVAPGDAEMTFPTTLGGGPATVTWTGTGGDVVELIVTGAATILCRADAADGLIEIDASLLPSAGTITFISAYAASATVMAGNYTVEAMVAVGQTATVNIE